MSKIINFLVNSEESNQRIDIVLNNKEKSLSRNRIKNLIIDEKLKINGKIIKNPSKKVNLGDELSLVIPEPKVTSLEPFNFKGLESVTKSKIGKIYRYYYGNTSNYTLIQKLKEEAVSKGYSNCFIVSFKNEERIPLNKALKGR